MNANKTKKIPVLDYGEIDDVLDVFNAEIIKFGPMAELEFLEGKLDKAHLDGHRKHRKYLQSVMKKLTVILNLHKKDAFTGKWVERGTVVEHIYPASKGGKEGRNNLRLVRKNENKN